MAGNQEWSLYEKRYLVAEALKASSMPLDRLIDIMRSIQPRVHVEDIALPPNRSFSSARPVYEELLRPYPLHSSQAPPTMLSNPGNKRPFSTYETHPSQMNRFIAPKPQHPPFPQPQSETPNKRKRGRPTKAEAQARQQQAAQQVGRAPSVPVTSTVALQATAATLLPAASNPIVIPENTKPAFHSVSRAPTIAALLTSNQGEDDDSPKSNRSSGSSGKKSRGRSRNIGPDDTPIAGSRDVGGPATTSPRSILHAAIEDPSAGAAVSRHRHKDRDDAMS